jgi:uncharacterized membrane protein (DUF485 family)
MVAARDGIRIAISLFVVVLVLVSAAGWNWLGTHLSRTQSVAGRGVLAAGIVAAGFALAVLWRRRPGDRP